MSESSAPTPTPALAAFSLQAGPRRGEKYPVTAPVITIGQGAQNDVVLTDDSVSKQHARLEYILEGWRLTDLDSTNGTTVEGVRLAPGVPTPLAYGSSVRFGGVRVVFVAVENANPEEARAAYAPAAPASADRPRHFRLPLWLFVLILIVLAAVLFFVFGLADAGATLP
jgi:predicted component of type VI protein secretion system